MILFAIIGTTLVLVGCGQGGGGTPAGTTGSFDVTWTIMGGDDCASLDADSVQIVSELTDTSEQFIESYKCTDGTAKTSQLPLGEYRVWGRLLCPAGSFLIQSDPVTAVIADAGETVSAALSFGDAVQGAIRAVWSIVTGDAETPTTCAAAGIETIQLVTEDAEGQETIDLFNCDDGVGETSPLPAGTYDVWINALDGADDVVATTPTREVPVSGGNRSPFSTKVNVP